MHARMHAVAHRAYGKVFDLIDLSLMSTGLSGAYKLMMLLYCVSGTVVAHVRLQFPASKAVKYVPKMYKRYASIDVDSATRS
jgi:hypothetical protein